MIRIYIALAVVAGCADPAATCSQSLADYCASGSLPCPPTLAQAEDPAAWGGCAASNRTANNNPLIEAACADVTVIELWGIDASTDFTYDTATGALLAVSGHQANRPNNDVCVAGSTPASACSAAPHDLCP